MRERVVKRLQSYWKMEAANVVLVPAIAAYVVHEFGGALHWPLAVAAASCSLMLIVGTAALRMELAELERRRDLAARLLSFARAARWPAMLTCAAGAAAAAHQLRVDEGWTPAAIGAAGLAILGALEYVNYYHVQLQHFDNAADFRRLVAGRGFRESHLSKALRRTR